MSTKQDFLVGKAHNFKEYVLKYKPQSAMLSLLEGFNESMLIPTIAAVVVPIVKAGKQEAAVRDFMAKLDVPEQETAAVAEKLVRYLNMFSEVLLATA